MHQTLCIHMYIFLKDFQSRSMHHHSFLAFMVFFFFLLPFLYESFALFLVPPGLRLFKILPFLPGFKKLLSQNPPAPIFKSFYAQAEAESFVVMLCKMPHCGRDISLPAWPPCQLSCSRAQSPFTTGEMGSIMCFPC